MTTAPPRLIDVPQGSAEWLLARVGLLTGSRAGDMLAQIKKGEAAARRDLRLQLACERLTGQPAEDRFVSRDMQRGTALEPVAIAAYEAATGAIVHRVGFLQHAELMAGCSPDGLVDDEGLVEIKCPKSATHLGYLRGRVVPVEHLGQIQHNTWITGRAWCDFVSFDDRFPPGLQLFVVRYHAHEIMQRAYERAVRAFLDEVAVEAAAVAALVERVAV